MPLPRRAFRFGKYSPLEEYPLGGGGMGSSTPAFSHPSRGESKA